MQRDRERLGKRRVAQRETRWHPDQLGLVNLDVFRKGALESVEIERGTPGAQDRPTGTTVFAASAARPRAPNDRVPQRPSRYLIAPSDDPPGVLVSSHRSRPPHAFE